MEQFFYEVTNINQVLPNYSFQPIRIITSSLNRIDLILAIYLLRLIIAEMPRASEPGAS